MNEEEEEHISGHLNYTTSSFKPDSKNMRSSKLMSSSNQLFSSMFNPTTSEFKRIKDIADAVRNNDSILQDQNKKIDQLKQQLKAVVKDKETLIFSQAK